MDTRTKLFLWSDPYDTAGTEDLFLSALRENAEFQYARCPAYRAVLDEFGFRPKELKTPADLARLPFLPTAFLKKHRMFSMPKVRRVVTASSSGTGGSGRSEIGLEAGALGAGALMVKKVFGSRGILSPKPCHYVVFGYDPRRGAGNGAGPAMAAAMTAYGYTFLAPALSRTFALRRVKGENGTYAYKPDLDGVISALARHERSPFPTRLMGFPAYVWFALGRMEERGIRLRLPEGSSVMFGGGWKQHYREAVDKEEMVRRIEKVLGIPGSRVFECYGAAEHPILYCACPARRFHIPVYSRVLIRDPRTFEPVPAGTPGLVNLITPMIRATPVLSVLTDDLGILHTAETDPPCPCGCKSPWLEILGRVGMTEIKTCAAGAERILGAVSG